MLKSFGEPFGGGYGFAGWLCGTVGQQLSRTPLAQHREKLLAAALEGSFGPLRQLRERTFLPKCSDASIGTSGSYCQNFS